MSHLDLDDGVLLPARRLRRGHRRASSGSPRAQGVAIETGARGRREIVDRRGAAARGVARRRRRRADARASPPTSSSRPPTCTTPRRRCCPPSAADLPREVVAPSATPGPGALLLMLGVRGRAPRSSRHHTLLFAEDWARQLRRHLRRHPRIPEPASLYVCRPSATDPDGRAARATRTSSCSCRCRPIPRSAAAASTATATPRSRRVADRGDRADRRRGAASRTSPIASCVRRTVAPGDFAADFNAWRGNALGLAHTLRQSAVFRAAQRVAQGRRASSYAGGVDAARASACRCASSAPSSCSKRLRGDRTPGPAARAARGCDDAGSSTSRRSSSAPACMVAARRCGSGCARGRGGAAGATAASRRDRHRVLPRLGRWSASRPASSSRATARCCTGIDLAPAAAARGARLPRVPLLPRRSCLGARRSLRPQRLRTRPTPRARGVR